MVIKYSYDRSLFLDAGSIHLKYFAKRFLNRTFVWFYKYHEKNSIIIYKFPQTRFLYNKQVKSVMTFERLCFNLF